MFRKSPLFVLVLLSVSYAPVLKPFRGTILPRGRRSSRSLVAYWSINEGTGNKVYDLSGNGNHGIIQGTPVWVPAKFGYGLDTAGGGYVDFGDLDAFDNLYALTISIWLKSYEAQNVSGADYILEKGGGGIDTVAVYWGQTDYVSVDVTSTESGDNLDGSKITDWLNWYHIVVVYDGSTWHLYYNGILDSSGGSWTPPLPSTSHPVTLCKDWNGIVDNCAVWNRALSASEIAELYRDPFAMFDSGSPKFYAPGGGASGARGIFDQGSQIFGGVVK